MRSTLLLIGLLVAAACRESAPALPEVPPVNVPVILTIGIASSAAGLPELVSPPLAAGMPEVVLQFIEGSTPVLLEDLAAGRLAAVLAHQVPADGDWWFQPVAVDGLVLVVHPDNPVTGLTRAEVQAIFNGRINNWAAVGGGDGAITLITREPGAGTLVLFIERVMNNQRIHINANIQANDAALRAAVQADREAIGYSMMGNASNVRSLPIDGIPATPADTAIQQYPISVPLYFLAPAEPTGGLRGILAWLQSEAGQETLSERYGRVR